MNCQKCYNKRDKTNLGKEVEKMNKTVDARGLACPKPVILTKKELENIESGSVTTLVDNEIAVKNLEKLASSLGYEVTYSGSENAFEVVITVGEGSTETVVREDLVNQTIVLGTNIMGSGSEELGKTLMKGFIYTLTETKPYPKTILCYNSGVLLTSEGSDSIDDLKKLSEAGVEILSCGTCLNYFGLGEKLLVGEVTNMYTIVEKMKEAENTIRI